MAFSSLQQPFTLKSLTVKNRIVMAPMERAMSPNHVHTPQMAKYYRRRAEADIGFIIGEATGIGRTASINHPNIPRFGGTAELAAWKRTLDEVHAGGAKMAPQLWHVGAMPIPTRRIGHEWQMPVPFDSPSGFHKKDVKLGEPLTDSDIADILDSYGEGARNAHRLGFDAMEVHAAHGYLIDQFFWADANKRTDRFGGATIKERVRFAVEIVKTVRKNVPADFVVSIRLSQWKQQELSARLAPTVREMEDWLGALSDAGVDIFHCSQRRFWEPEFEGSDLNFAGWAKKLTGKPSITVGSVGLSGDFIDGVFKDEIAKPASLDELVRRLERGDFDLVAVGRALLMDPLWFVKVRDGRHDELMTYSKESHAVLY